ncbi:MAG: hypothetical protein IPF99_18700 [Deltaproteobacteria bacterium]|nr:hypothetical protein [Deltaproteobacteria bacterium]
MQARAASGDGPRRDLIDDGAHLPGVTEGSGLFVRGQPLPGDREVDDEPEFVGFALVVRLPGPTDAVLERAHDGVRPIGLEAPPVEDLLHLEALRRTLNAPGVGEEEVDGHYLGREAHDVFGQGTELLLELVEELRLARVGAVDEVLVEFGQVLERPDRRVR